MTSNTGWIGRYALMFEKIAYNSLLAHLAVPHPLSCISIRKTPKTIPLIVVYTKKEKKNETLLLLPQKPSKLRVKIA